MKRARGFLACAIGVRNMTLPLRRRRKEERRESSAYYLAGLEDIQNVKMLPSCLGVNLWKEAESNVAGSGPVGEIILSTGQSVTSAAGDVRDDDWSSILHGRCLQAASADGGSRDGTRPGGILTQ
ncbi:hypothetical protein NDU88_000992 [Pleurodeles waltl]|uniref:Uncharacterized protein n=1 Tax=Pleurodeles waltl TaxID=8319 RepID=A0AAV7N9J1_PLEWA|nr:hypothetical protein NDU88_000992 [Pleurodeles waltl]